MKCSESIGLLLKQKEPVCEPENENTVPINEVIEVEQVTRMMTGTAEQPTPESEPRIVGEIVGPEQVISEPERAGDNSCQRIVTKPVLLFIKPEELITEVDSKRTAQPTQVANSHGETDAVIILESSSESEDGSSLELQLQIWKVPYVLAQ